MPEQPSAYDELFYVICLDRSRIGKDLVFWKPQDRGYTTRVSDAGRYTRRRIEMNGSLYSDGQSTLAVPCIVVDGYAILSVRSSNAVMRVFLRTAWAPKNKKPKRRSR